MSSYIGELRAEGYTSLRDTHFETIRTSIPLLGSPRPPQPQDMHQVDHLDHKDNEDDDDDEDDKSQTHNPIESEELLETDTESGSNNESEELTTKASSPDNDTTHPPNQPDKDQTHNPAESEKLLDTVNKSGPNNESAECPSKATVPEGDSVVPGPKDTTQSAIPLPKPKPVPTIKKPPKYEP